VQDIRPWREPPDPDPLHPPVPDGRRNRATSSSPFCLPIVKTTTLYRPVGPEELKLIENSNWTAFPPRLPEQPIFYPVTNEPYAIQIARDWNVPASGSGFVTRFEVDSDYLEKFAVQTVGGREHTELWVPAEELDEFNRHIVGRIEVTRRFPES
jgi:hypothetical protein